MIDWTSPEWGMAGHNVHESSTGSWLEAESTSGKPKGSTPARRRAMRRSESDE